MHTKPTTISGGRQQRGFTLVELMVALLLSSLVALAAMSALVVARRGFSTVDAGGQLRDNARFAIDILQKVVAQGGYQDVADASNTNNIFKVATTAAPLPYIEGYNNAAVAAASAPYAATNSRDTSTALGCATSTDTACANGSDVLIVRYRTSETFRDSGKTDGTMIDCMGATPTTPDLIVNVFHVQRGVDGEPNLVCSSNASGAFGPPQPLVQGVETFQVLYGMHEVTPNTAPLPFGPGDKIPGSYLRADQIVVPGNPDATQKNWERVRSLRIGMVLRGPLRSSQEPATPVKYPLGQGFADTSNDKGSVFAAQTDGRLRQTVTLTIYLHNYQGT